ncbi:hypothetical protein [Rothia sp. ZJ932]|uniref:hypothetical protein n=1 Tax=Rothia sp. ZJ932 TaxID=2810516 RepID=UPI00196757FE|nr:hypothetical protein [Rothia sp. ZJ932]QRZ61795.1 hypothetical protein JR346_01235 [Rothia sp. ZJ932]
MMDDEDYGYELAPEGIDLETGEIHDGKEDPAEDFFNALDSEPFAGEIAPPSTYDQHEEVPNVPGQSISSAVLMMQVEETRQETAAAFERLSRLETDVEVALESIDALVKKIGDGEGKKKPRVYNWRHQDNRQTRTQMWQELKEFVDWLNHEYFAHDIVYAIPGCWYKHSDAVHVLSALWGSWLQAYHSSKEFPNSEAAGWHMQFLWPMLDRLKGSLQPCIENEGRHVVRSPIYKPTDEGFEEYITQEGHLPGFYKPSELITRLAAGKKATTGSGQRKDT